MNVMTFIRNSEVSHSRT